MWTNGELRTEELILRGYLHLRKRKVNKILIASSLNVQFWKYNEH